MEIVWLLVSLVILYYGAEGLVSGASSLAKRVGVSPLIIGLTIVSIGTSMPELVVSAKAAMIGQSALSIGNVLGSNMINIGVILGLSAMIYPIAVNRQLLNLDVPFMVFSSVLFLLLFLDSKISRVEAGLLILLFISYISYLIITSTKGHKNKPEQKSQNTDEIKMSKHWSIDLLFIVVGLLALVYGSDLLVVNSIIIAERLGMSEAMIGLTIVAIGTSMPELATSVVAAIKKRSDIAIGNVIGSNIFNILLVLGVAGLIHPISTPEINYMDSLFVVALGLVLWLFMKLGTRIRRWQGTTFIFIYVLYFIIKLSI
ncbi:MAG: calcium/sodium antiporter [Fermentimonas sp.]|nr:calcium/sodium antiporter [Fermentimonas sp.]MDD2931862.1 calcium/sodium antiporter [Fermentimonas sp.]MDD3189158.1 calcium/sodium antiporter [Fermentimonas sp.]MDD3511431.1 calcium/sodium antiporter [Fermentimonas sp.]MDD4284690.1 calcium/sodium antiporter [Fermentimonas sp.]